MSLGAWVTSLHESFDPAQAMADLAAVAEHDRYQASTGIRSAAAVVAERAQAAGLSDVQILEFPADGEKNWWTFLAPAAWTPGRAALWLVDREGRLTERVLSYPDDPYSLAVNSAATPAGGVTAELLPLTANVLGRSRDARARAALEGAVVLVDNPVRSLVTILDQLSDYGALGAICRPAGPADSGQARRIELPGRSPQWALSVTPSQMGRLARWATAGGRVHVTVETVRSGVMPVVTARLPGASNAETLLMAHLCHARPGANDNASGVAALLGIARALTRSARPRPAHSIRFLWGPEYVGLAAYLCEAVGRGGLPMPFAAINIDMAGEDQRVCGGPLIVERAPDHVPSWLSAVVEECVRGLPQASRSYSGAIPCDTWAWRATPFVGASDHCLLADRSVACPSVQLGHWPDRFNHSSADTLDKVDPDELRRTACAAGAAIAAVSYAASGDDTDIENVTASWAAARLLECLPSLDSSQTLDERWVDPFAPALSNQRLAHRTDLAVGAILALDVLYPDRRQSHLRTAEWIRGLAAHVGTRLGSDSVIAQQEAPGAVLSPAWPGPFNVRGLMHLASAGDRAWLTNMLDADRGGSYAVMLAIAHAIDSRTDQRGILHRAAFSAGLPIEVSHGERFLDLLLQVGWADEADRRPL